MIPGLSCLDGLVGKGKSWFSKSKANKKRAALGELQKIINNRLYMLKMCTAHLTDE